MFPACSLPGLPHSVHSTNVWTGNTRYSSSWPVYTHPKVESLDLGSFYFLRKVLDYQGNSHLLSPSSRDSIRSDISVAGLEEATCCPYTRSSDCVSFLSYGSTLVYHSEQSGLSKVDIWKQTPTAGHCRLQKENTKIL